MNSIKTVFKFTFKDAIKRKSFLVTTIIFTAVILIACAVPRIIASFNSGEPSGVGGVVVGETVTPTKTGYVLDEDGLISAVLPELKKEIPDISFVEISSDDFEKYRSEIAEDSNKFILMVGKSDKSPLPKIDYYIRGIMDTFVSSTLSTNIKDLLVEDYFVKNNIPSEAKELVFADIESETFFAEGNNAAGYVIGIIITFLMFFCIYSYGVTVASSVAAEKSSRVMETLVVSAKPSHVLIGKCLAMGAVGLLQTLSFLLAGLIGLVFILPKSLVVDGMPFAVPSLPPTLFPLLLLYFCLGFTLYAMLSSICGASISRAEDLQMAIMPITLVGILSFYFSYFTTISTNLLLGKIALYVPFTAAFTAPNLIASGAAKPYEILISLVILTITIVVVSVISIRIYSASVLHYGERLKFKDLIHRAKKI